MEPSAKPLAQFHSRNRGLAALLTACALFSRPAGLIAHDIPADSTVRMFVKPEGARLHVLVRVPMASINDIDWPTQRTGYLDLSRVEPFLRDASTLWIADFLDVYEDGIKLAYPALTSVRLSTEGDTSFTTYEDALAHVSGPRLEADTNLLPNQGALDVLFDYAIQSDQSRFALHPKFDRFGIRVLTILRFVFPDGTVRPFEYQGGDPGLIRLDPSWLQAAGGFAVKGFQSLFGGVDHLLFLLCAVMPFRRLRTLGLIATSFIVAHSITLVAAGSGMMPNVSWFPPLIDTLIAVSVLYVAVENVVGFRDANNAGAQRRALVAFAFGLIHGFGYAIGLGPVLQFAGSHVMTSVGFFDIGGAAAELATLAVVVPALALLFRFVVGEWLGTIVVSALAAHTGWHWLTTRASLLWRYQFVWPEFTAAFFADVLRWLMLAVAVAGILWLGSLVVRSTRLFRSSTP